MINSFVIDGFRGINNLAVNELNHVNLIVGDNNSGKTSVLEALQLLRNPGELANVFRVARTRDTAMFSSGISIFENFTCMFPHDESSSKLGITAVCDGTTISCRINGQLKRILIDVSETNDHLTQRDLDGELEADEFQGTIFYELGAANGSTTIQLNSYTRLSGTTVSRNSIINIAYISPCDHLRGNVINRIVRNDGYKEICIKALQLFDPDIVDMVILKSTTGNRPVEYLKHKTLGTMPISTFGDGIKKVLVLANAIAQATGGVLLIDEVETAIHKKYYDDIFRFLVKACKAFDVQVFITTHSIEAVDGLLATQDYEEQSEIDDISVVTLKRINNHSYSRVLTGRNVAADREAFNFEVRL